MQAAMVSEGFLAESLLLSELSHTFTQRQQDLLHASSLRLSIRTRLQTKRLQTICNVIKWRHQVPEERIMKNHVVVMLLLFGMTGNAKERQFPLTAKVVSSNSKDVVTGSSTRHDQPRWSCGTAIGPARSRTSVDYGTITIVTAEIGDRIYKFSGKWMLNPGEYPASVDNGKIWLRFKDRKGKQKEEKFRIVSVAAKPAEPAAQPSPQP